jgi:hypothetical protein
MRQSRPKGHWNDIANQKIFFDQLAETLKIQRPEDWYNVSVESVVSKGGSFLNSHYNGSLVRGTRFYWTS